MGGQNGKEKQQEKGRLQKKEKLQEIARGGRTAREGEMESIRGEKITGVEGMTASERMTVRDT